MSRNTLVLDHQHHITKLVLVPLLTETTQNIGSLVRTFKHLLTKGHKVKVALQVHVVTDQCSPQTHRQTFDWQIH